MKSPLRIILLGMILLCLSAGANGATILETPDPYHHEGAVAEGGTWQADLDYSAYTFITGDELKLDVALKIESTGLAYNLDKTRGIYCLLTGQRLFDGSGQFVGQAGALLSTHLTGSGMPVESEEFRVPHPIFGSKRISPVTSYVKISPNSLRIDKTKGEITVDFAHIIPIEDDIPPGFYQIRLDFGIEVTPTMRLTLMGMDPASVDPWDKGQSSIVSRLIDINASASPRMIWSLFSQFHPSGGALCIEDDELAALSRRRGSFDRCIIPLKDQFGRQVRYLLEPDFPSEKNRFLRRETGCLNLDYSRGWVSLRIQTPSGTTVDCGSGPFIGPRGMGATTGSESFFFSFSHYGRHLVECKGWIADKYGTVFQGGGVFEVWVAQPIIIDPATPPGRPIAPMELYNTAFHLYPAFNAGVRIDQWLERGESGKVAHDSFNVRANRFGQFLPDLGTSRQRITKSGIVRFNEPGLYRIRYQAEHREKDGTLWMGQLESFGVVYNPDSPLNADGTAPPEAVLPFPTTEKPANNTNRIEYPLKTDEVVFLPDNNYSFFDPLLTFKPSLFAETFRGDEDVLVPIGESRGLTYGTGAALSAVSYYEKINRAGLQVFSSVRSDGIMQMAVAEMSPDSKTHPHSNPFNTGELPRDEAGDYYILSGGLYYNDLMGKSHLELPYVTGGYVTDEYAGPIYSRGGDIEINGQSIPRQLFTGFHAVHPGDILHNKQYFIIDAVAFPNMPVDYEIIISQPDGMVVRKRGTSDRFGFINNPDNWHKLGNDGVYKISYAIFRDEKTGYPIGTSDETEGSFNIYVIDGGNDNRIDFNLDRVTKLDVSQKFSLNGDLSSIGIVGGRAYITVAFQGGLVDEVVLDISDGRFTYKLDPYNITSLFSNYTINDPNDRLDITVFVMGVTENGKVRYAADRLYTYGPYLYSTYLRYEAISPEESREKGEAYKTEEKVQDFRRKRGKI